MAARNMLKSRERNAQKQERRKRRDVVNVFERNVLLKSIEQSNECCDFSCDEAAAATSARAAATAATLTSYSKREDLESKKEQQRQAWTAESKTQGGKWYVFVREHI